MLFPAAGFSDEDGAAVRSQSICQLGEDLLDRKRAFRNHGE